MWDCITVRFIYNQVLQSILIPNNSTSHTWTTSMFGFPLQAFDPPTTT